jgi:pimeloyl-ACP methyl ester carboxylesterase
MTAVPTELTPPVPRRTAAVPSADGTRIAVEIHGPEGAPTVVLAHGWSCSTVFWAPLLRRLATDLRVVAYDQRGHGASQLPGRGGISAAALADDLAAVLTATVPAGRRVVAVGHSMGAMSIVALAGRHHELLRARVAAALLASTGVDELVGRIDVLSLPGRVTPGLPDQVARVVQFFVRGGIADSRLLHALPPTVQRTVVKHVTLSAAATDEQVAFCADVILSCPRSTHHAFARLLQGLDLSADVPFLDVPALVLVGGADRLTPPWHARRLGERLPVGLGVVEVPGIGHMTPVQAPDQVAAAVRRLASDHLAGSGPGPGRALGRRAG